MKINILLSILFTIVTTFSAIHELEHIHQDHPSLGCQFCILDDHSTPPENKINYVNTNLFTFQVPILTNQLFISHKQKTTDNINAPPFKA